MLILLSQPYLKVIAGSRIIKVAVQNCVGFLSGAIG